MKEEMVSLKWDFTESRRLTFDNQKNNGTFVDVTLVTADGKTIGAHKLVLSMGSRFLADILAKFPDQHATIMLPNINFRELQPLVEFMYLGVIHIAETLLNGLLEAADILKVGGLFSLAKDPVVAPRPLSPPTLAPILPKVESAPPRKRRRTESFNEDVQPAPEPVSAPQVPEKADNMLGLIHATPNIDETRKFIIERIKHAASQKNGTFLPESPSANLESPNESLLQGSTAPPTALGLPEPALVPAGTLERVKFIIEHIQLAASQKNGTFLSESPSSNLESLNESLGSRSPPTALGLPEPAPVPAETHERVKFIIERIQLAASSQQNGDFLPDPPSSTLESPNESMLQGPEVPANMLGWINSNQMAFGAEVTSPTEPEVPRTTNPVGTWMFIMRRIQQALLKQNDAPSTSPESPNEGPPIRKYKTYSEATLWSALMAIFQGHSINSTSQLYKVPSRTLRDYMRKHNIVSAHASNNARAGRASSSSPDIYASNAQSASSQPSMVDMQNETYMNAQRAAIGPAANFMAAQTPLQMA